MTAFIITITTRSHKNVQIVKFISLYETEVLIVIFFVDCTCGVGKMVA